MLATKDDVKEAILAAFNNSDVSDIDEIDGRVTGTIRWDGFKGMDLDERYDRVTEAVWGRLGSRGLNIGFLLPLAPGDKP